MSGKDLASAISCTLHHRTTPVGRFTESPEYLLVMSTTYLGTFDACNTSLSNKYAPSGKRFSRYFSERADYRNAADRGQQRFLPRCHRCWQKVSGSAEREFKERAQPRKALVTEEPHSSIEANNGSPFDRLLEPPPMDWLRVQTETSSKSVQIDRNLTGPVWLHYLYVP